MRVTVNCPWTSFCATTSLRSLARVLITREISPKDNLQNRTPNYSVLQFSAATSGLLNKLRTTHQSQEITNHAAFTYLDYLYEGWDFNSGNYLFTTDTK